MAVLGLRPLDEVLEEEHTRREKRRKRNSHFRRSVSSNIVIDHFSRLLVCPSQVFGVRRNMAGRNALSQLLRVKDRLGGVQTVRRVASRGLSGQSQGDDIVKHAFATQQSKFRAFLVELSKAKFTLNPEDAKAVTEYGNTIKGIRSKLQIPSYTEKLADLLDLAGDDCSDVRSYLQLQTQLRQETGIQDDLGADKLMIEALDKVEKNLGKVLLMDDAKGLTLFGKEVDEINKKLGLDEAQLEKLEDEVERAVAKGELEELTKEAREKIETYKRRDELDAIAVDPKDLDFRPFL